MSLGETRKFNTFKVLRYADYEIRHSNVLAWLLHPSETHSVGDRFLEWFVRHINGRLEAAGLEILPEVDLAPLNVRVERELDYVNITIFFKREKYLITIENKTGPASAEHRDQIMAYEGTLRGKYEDYRIQSVLLTTSPDDKAQFPATAHMSWSSVRESIESLRVAGEFPSSSVQSFFRQYLELLENWLRPAGDGGFEGLLKEMRRVWEKDGEKGVRIRVPEAQADYRDTIVELAQQSRMNPKDLRKVVAGLLKRYGFKLHLTHNAAAGTDWLNWTNTDLSDAERKLGGGDLSLWWGMTFKRHTIRAGFYLHQSADKDTTRLDRLICFMESTPISRQEQYAIRNNGFGWHQVFDYQLLSTDELADLSAPEIRQELVRRLEEFMDSAEYWRIEDYFRCLAFRPDIPT